MGGSIGEHVWRQSYKMSTSQVTFGANLIKCQLLMSTSTVILAQILQSVNFSIYRYILGNTNTGVCSDIGNTNTSIHPVSYCPIWDEAVLIPDLSRAIPRFRHWHLGGYRRLHIVPFLASLYLPPAHTCCCILGTQTETSASRSVRR